MQRNAATGACAASSRWQRALLQLRLQVAGQYMSKQVVGRVAAFATSALCTESISSMGGFASAEFLKEVLACTFLMSPPD